MQPEERSLLAGHRVDGFLDGEQAEFAHHLGEEEGGVAGADEHLNVGAGVRCPIHRERRPGHLSQGLVVHRLGLGLEVGAHVVVEQPVGHRIRQMYAPGVGQIGDGAPGPLGVAGLVGGQEDHVGAVDGGQGVGAGVPVVAGPRTPGLVAQHGHLGLVAVDVAQLVPRLHPAPHDRPLEVQVHVAGPHRVQRGDLAPLGVEPLHQLQGHLALFGPVLLGEEAAPVGSNPRGPAQGGHALHVAGEVLELEGPGHELEGGAGVGGHHVEQVAPLVVVGPAAGHQPVVAVEVHQRGRQAEGPGGQPLVEHSGHLGPLGLGGGPLPRLGPHDPHPQGLVGEEGGHVERRRVGVVGGLVLGPGLPCPGDGRLEGVGGQVLDEAHQLDELVAVGLPQRGQPQPAVGQHHAGGAVRRHGVDVGIPPQRPVVVGVGFDESRCHQGAASVDLRLAVGPQPRLHLDDHPRSHPHVGFVGGSTGAIHHRAATNQEIAFSHV